MNDQRLAKVSFDLAQYLRRVRQVAALLLYSGVSSAMGLIWVITFRHLRHPDLLADDVPVGFFRTKRRRAVAGIVAPFAPALIGPVSPVSALAVMGSHADVLPRDRGRDYQDDDATLPRPRHELPPPPSRPGDTP